MDTIIVDYNAQEAFVKNHRDQFQSLVSRFNAGETLPLPDLARAYYAAPFAGYKPLSQLVQLAHRLYRIRDYRVAYFMYLDALEQDPFSLLLLKKAANASFFDVIDPSATRRLRQCVKQLQDVIAATGDGKSASTAYHVTQTSDEYQILYDVYHVRDVVSQRVVKTENNEVYDEMTVEILGQSEPLKVYFACHGETQADMQDFFDRKKTY